MTPIELLAMLYMLVQGFTGGGASAPAEVEPSKPTPAKPTPSKPTPSKPTPAKPTPAKPTPAKKPATILPASTEAPKPWPVSTIPTMPKYPNGWEAYVPPPPSVVSRANQLMGELWKSGKVGVTKVEQTDGVWVTYVTFAPSKGKRGVAAYKLKDGASVPSGAIVRA